MLKKQKVEIRLYENPVYVDGSREEALGCVLRGEIIVTFNETTKVKKISLEMKSREQVSWCEDFIFPLGGGNKLFQQTKTLLDQKWSLLKDTKSRVFQPGRYVFQFELGLPGDLPESVKTDYGVVWHKLVVKVQRSRFLPNLSADTEVLIKRQCSSFLLNQAEPLLIDNSWESLVKYQVGISSRVYSDLDTIPIKFYLEKLCPDATIDSISAYLKEYVQVTIKDNHQVRSKKFSIDVGKSHKPIADTSSDAVFRDELCLQIPKVYEQIQYDCSTSLLQVSHRLKVLIRIQDKDKKYHTIYIGIPIKIACRMDEFYYSLPPYPGNMQVDSPPCYDTLL